MLKQDCGLMPKHLYKQWYLVEKSLDNMRRTFTNLGVREFHLQMDDFEDLAPSSK